ncbi:Transcription factor [Dirofilaria immitis]
MVKRKLIKQVLLANERQFNRGLTNNSISISLIKTERNSQAGEDSNCYSSATQPSTTAQSEATTTELSGDRRDDEISVSTSSVTSNANDAAQMDIYRDLILRHLIQDINTTCTKLGLPTDPQAWSAEHSARWMSEMCVQFQLPPPRQLYMNGRTLLSMTQDDFMVRAPEGGDTLHAQLQLWKTAYDSYSQQNSSNNNSGNNQSGSQIIQNCNRPSQYWVNPSPLALNVAEQGELLTSAQDYLNNFNPSNTDTAIGMSCYSNSTYQNASQEAALLGNAAAQQQYYASAQAAGIGILPSPSDSEISSNGSSMNDVNTIDGTIIDTRQTNTPQFPRHSGTVHLWHFIRELLDHPKQYSSCVRWVDRQEGTFKIESSHHLARFWGQRKNRAQMNYDKLSRSLRQYYKKGIIQKPEKKQRLVYKFLPPYNL